MVGDNMIEHSDNMPWYKGPFLLEALDALNPSRTSTRSPVSAQYPSVALRPVPSRRVSSALSDPNVTTEIKSVEMHHESVDEAVPGDNVGFNVKGLSVTDIKRGYVASDSKHDPAGNTAMFLAQVIVLNHPG